ncbi:TPA: DUF551 domain-containing protein [Salmonella enterica]|uniref:DUF551 domain-containing protein n=1 Tax=Salmonella enterica TaxID=28901 RepID=A0A759YJD9_SALER|nr:DUF551 domain-containing protein [Salmonella enterica]
MKRLTDERIAALIDMVSLELQERRKTDSAIPVGYVSESAIFCLSTGQHDVITGKPEKNADDKRYWDVIPLYTAPPVPDEMTIEAAYPEVQTGWNDAKNYTAGWNACRAAMLNQAPVKQPESNPQWIKCSDRLPPEEYEPDGGAVFYLAWHKNEPERGSQYSLTNVVFLRRHWENWYSHWMPLPPAPEAENAND